MAGSQEPLDTASGAPNPAETRGAATVESGGRGISGRRHTATGDQSGDSGCRQHAANGKQAGNPSVFTHADQLPRRTLEQPGKNLTLRAVCAVVPVSHRCDGVVTTIGSVIADHDELLDAALAVLRERGPLSDRELTVALADSGWGGVDD